MTNAQRPHGQQLIELPQYNKGTAFSREERIAEHLLGLLPYAEETLEDQVVRAYHAYVAKDNDLERHIYLRQLQDLNETLFYRLVIDYAAEMIPIIYTPTVGDACKYFSEIYRKPRGLFISYPDRYYIEEIFSNVTAKDVRIVVITDSESILGIGDQGVGGMGIPIGKLTLYSALGGIDPKVCLPILLDVGTNNEQLLNDPLYVGWQHERVRGAEYDDFVEQVLLTLHRRWPNVVVQFEDFGSGNATRLLETYIDLICCFNDDIQGTAAVTVGCLMSAVRMAGKELSTVKVVIAGAGSAGCGIARGFVKAVAALNKYENGNTDNVYLVDLKGLVRDELDKILPHQAAFVKTKKDLENWRGTFNLVDVIRNVKPDVLIGVTGQSGLFTHQIVDEMHSWTRNPIIFPLSNPTPNCEAAPIDLMRWTDGSALVATGSPYPSINYGGMNYEIAQCNNAYVFPGVGLGLVAVNSRRVTDEMFTKVAEVISKSVPDSAPRGASLLPHLGGIKSLSRDIAIAVAHISVANGLGTLPEGKTVEEMIDAITWEPNYEN